MAFYVYILASQRNGTLYIGYTDDLSRRLIEHRAGTLSRFASKYGVLSLVYYEQHESRDAAWSRERAMKKRRRAWKIALSERFNPSGDDLTHTITN